jgi:hypothetical protein
MSDDVGRTEAGRAWSEMLGRFWNRVAITMRSKAISTSGLDSAILTYGGPRMSGYVGSNTGRTGVVQNVVQAWNRVAIALRSNAISTSGLESAILTSGGPRMSGDVGRDRGGSGVAQNVGYVLVSRCYHIAFKSYLYFRFRFRHFDLRWSADVGVCRK